MVIQISMNYIELNQLSSKYFLASIKYIFADYRADICIKIEHKFLQFIKNT